MRPLVPDTEPFRFGITAFTLKAHVCASTLLAAMPAYRALGIRTMLVEPGFFRIELLSDSSTT
jgi:hypothetical protein